MSRRLLLLALFIFVFTADLAARGGGRRPGPPEAKVTADGDLERIEAEDPEGAVGFLYTPKSLAEGKKGGLVVMLHGHGGTPKGVILRPVAEELGWLYLSVQGGGTIQDGARTGHTWSTPDVDSVLALTRWTIANRPVDPEQVVLYGFSAGGTMVLATYPEAPELFAGIMTNSSPTTPTGAHDAARIVVFLGTLDGNFANAKPVRSAFHGRKVGGSLQVMVGAEHNDLAKPAYVSLALRWILEKNARGNEVHYPKDPPAAAPGELRHICVAWTGAEDAPADLRRKKSSALSLAKSIQKYIEKGRAWFPHEAQAWSSDMGSAPLGGVVTKERLLDYGLDEAELDKKLSGLKDGEVAGPLESRRGYHLVVPAAVAAEGGQDD